MRCDACWLDDESLAGGRTALEERLANHLMKAKAEPRERPKAKRGALVCASLRAQLQSMASALEGGDWELADAFRRDMLHLLTPNQFDVLTGRPPRPSKTKTRWPHYPPLAPSLRVPDAHTVGMCHPSEVKRGDTRP